MPVSPGPLPPEHEQTGFWLLAEAPSVTQELLENAGPCVCLFKRSLEDPPVGTLEQEAKQPTAVIPDNGAVRSLSTWRSSFQPDSF